MTNPYPISREAREEEIFRGDGRAVYGPFDLKIFDVLDVEVWTRADDAATWSSASPTVTKTNGAAFDTFVIAFPANITSSVRIKVQSKRVPERAAGVVAGTRIDPTALEKELSKFASMLQELRRDVGRSIQVRFGAGYAISGDLADGDTLMISGLDIVAGPNSSDIRNAQGFAEAAQISATSSGDSADSAAIAETGAIDARNLAQRWASEPLDSVVSGGLYSAFHWAQKAAAIVLAGLVDLSVTTQKIANGAVTQAKLSADIVSGWSAKPSMADADQFLIGDSAASSVAKTLTLGNLLASIFNGTRAIANGIFLTASLKLRNASGFDLAFLTTALTANRSVSWPNGDVTIPAGTLVNNSHTHSAWAQISAAMAAMSAGGVGSLVLAETTVAVDFGGVVAGSALSPSTGSGTNSGSLSGTWLCLGYAIPSGTVTLFLRIS